MGDRDALIRVQVEVMPLEHRVQTDAGSGEVVDEQVIADDMGLAAKEADPRGTPPQLNRVANEGVGLGDARLTMRVRVDARPGSQAIVAVAAHRRVTHRRMGGALREVHAIGQVVTNAGILDDHALRVAHVAGVHVVAHPEAALEVLHPHVRHAGVRSRRAGKALVLSILRVAGLQVGRHVEVGDRHAADLMVEREAASGDLVRRETQVGVPHARTLDRQVGVINADLAAQLPSARGDVDRLGGGVRSLIHRPDQRVRVVNTITGLGTLVITDTHGARRTRNLGQRLLKLDEVNAVGVLIVANLNDLNMITRANLAIQQRVRLVEAETGNGRRGRLAGLVIHEIAADILPGSLGGKVQCRGRFTVHAHVNAAGGVIRQGEAQVQCVARDRGREVDERILVIQGHIGLARGLNRRRLEVVGALEGRPLRAARFLRLVAGVGKIRAVVVVGRHRGGNQHGNQRDDAEGAHAGNERSTFHLLFIPQSMPGGDARVAQPRSCTVPQGRVRPHGRGF